MNVFAWQRGGWKIAFFAIWGGEAVSLVGSNLAQFALVWWLTKTSGSATVLATATLVAMLPGIFLGPLAGAFVDRWSRRMVMIVSDGVSAVAAGCLAYLFWTGSIQIWHVYVVMFVRSIANSFQWPAMQASTSLMVPEQQLGRVAGLNQTLQGSVNIVSPPLGALLIGILPFHAIMAVDMVTAVPAILALVLVRIPQPPAREATMEARPSVLADLREGLQYVWRWPGLLALMLMATLINFLLNPAFSLTPILVIRHFGGDTLHLSWIDSTFGIGIVVGGLLLSVWGGFRRRILTSLAGLIGVGCGTLVIGLTPRDGFWVALSAMGLLGVMQPLTNGPIFAILQSVVAPEMQGRVFTLIGSIAGAMSPLSLAIAGPLADRFGVQTWYLLGGIGCLAMGIGSFFIPVLTGLESQAGRPQSSRSTGSLSPGADPAVD